MSRVNVEDDFLKGYALPQLSKRIAKKYRINKKDEATARWIAIGCMVTFWHAAQEFWGRGEQLLPMEVFHDVLGLPIEILDPDLGFAEVREEGIFCSDAQQKFNWILKNRENARRGGIARQKSKPNKINTNSQPTACDSLSPLTPTLTLNTTLLTKSSRPLEKFGPSDLAKIWNQKAPPMLPRVRDPEKMNSKWMRDAAARIKLIPDPKDWEAAIERIGRSDFLTGRQASKDHPNWRANFEWLIRTDTFDKLTSGHYDSKRSVWAPPTKKLAEEREPELTVEQQRENAARAREMANKLRFSPRGIPS